MYIESLVHFSMDENGPALVLLMRDATDDVIHTSEHIVILA